MDSHEIKQRLVQLSEAVELAELELVAKESREGELLFGRGKAGRRAIRAYDALSHAEKLISEFNNAIFDEHVFSVRSQPQAPRQNGVDACRCTEMWPDHPCGYCHTAEERRIPAYPGVDACEEAGMDGTLRGLDGRPVGEPITWKELAEKLLADREGETR